MGQDDGFWDGRERRNLPHPYEFYQHVDTRLIQIREDLARVGQRQDDHERKLRGIEDSIQQAAGMARLLRIVIAASAIVWGFLAWSKDHLVL